MQVQRRGTVSAENERAVPVVVIAEDEAGLRSAWLALLEECGYDVHDAADGKRALALIRSVRPHVVITDLIMPVEDGRTLARAMRADAGLRAIPIVAATGDFDAADRELFDVILRKPFSLSVLLRALAKLLKAGGAPLPFGAFGYHDRGGGEIAGADRTTPCLGKPRPDPGEGEMRKGRPQRWAAPFELAVDRAVAWTGWPVQAGRTRAIPVSSRSRMFPAPRRRGSHGASRRLGSGSGGCVHG